MIKELVTLARGVLTLDHATYVNHIQSRNALKRGLMLIVIVALLSSLFTFLGNLAGSFNQPSIADIRREFMQSLEQQMQLNPAWQDREFRKMFEGSLEEGLGIAEDIMKEPLNLSFLPRWLESLLGALGRWLSTPLAWLGAWAWYALWVLLVAKLMGGRATLERMLGATALFAVPHAFYILGDLINLAGSLPAVGACIGFIGSLIGLALFVWGVVIYIKATAVVNEFSMSKAAVATLLPSLVAIAIASIGLMLIVLLALLGASS